MRTRCESLDECVVVSGFPISNLAKKVTVTECVEWLGRPHWLYFGDEIIAMNGQRAHCIADDCLLPFRRHSVEEEVHRMEKGGIPLKLMENRTR